MDEIRDSGNTNSESSEAALRDLALRLLSSNYGYAHTTEAEELLVGKLPEPMPDDIPILEDSRVIGSLIYTALGARSCTILLGSDVSPEQVLDYYDERLEATGWNLPDMSGLNAA